MGERMVVLASPSRPDLRLVSKRAIASSTTSKMSNTTNNVAKCIFLGINRNQFVATKSHQKVPISVDTALNCCLLKNESNENNARAIPPDLSYAEELKLEDVYNYEHCYPAVHTKSEVTVRTKLNQSCI